jgi:hypothetical protein
MVQAEPWIRERIEQVVSERSLSFHRKQAHIRFASLGTHSTVLGAAYAAISGFFSKDRVTW